MNLADIDFDIICEVVIIVCSIALILRNHHKKMLKHFEHMDVRLRFEMISERITDVEEEIKYTHSEVRDCSNGIADIKERLSFLEASAIYTMPMEAAQPNARSEAAKEMWKKRRAAKQIDTDK